jgi:hypothetical protein
MNQTGGEELKFIKYQKLKENKTIKKLMEQPVS